MELLKTKLILIALMMSSLSCADNYKSVLSSPVALQTEKKLDQSFLEGEYVKEDGSSLLLSSLNDKPILLFFVGEFCGACRQEAVHLKEMVLQKGLPTKIHLISVMIEVDPGVITDWLSGISPTADHWKLGSDPDLNLYFKYFNQLVTPSVLYFDPQSQTLKRWQAVVPLQQLEQETTAWY